MKKRCNKCGETKSIKQFSKDKGSQDGYQYKCKSCVREYNQSEKGKQGQKRYDQSEKGKKRDGRYIRSERGRQTNRKRHATRRTNETQAGGSYSPDQWFNLCKFYDFRCLGCNKKLLFEKLTLDHVKPVSKGGSSDIWNTQPLCDRCNKKKGNKEIDYRKTLPPWINRDGPVWQQDTLF